MSADLIRTKRFFPLLATQFLGALNDNLFKNALLTMVTVKMTAQSDMLSNLIAGLFILPFFLFSATAGQLADKYPRDKIARILKITEFVLMFSVAVAYFLGSIGLLIVIMTLMGAQSAFFGPVKYALLPQHLKPQELVLGNAYVESTTYLAILLGLILGTLLPTEITIGLLITLALAGWFAASYIPSAPAPRPDSKVYKNVLTATLVNYRFLRRLPQVYMSILGASWFWLIGAFAAVQIYPLCGKVLNAGEGVISFFLVLFSVGVGVGSFACNKVLKGFIHMTYVPLCAVGMAVSLFLIYFFTSDYPSAATRMSFVEFLTAPHTFAISFNLFALAFWGGMYIIPLNAFMQSRAPKAYVATVIAGNNIINSLAMVFSAVLALVLLALGLNLPQLFLSMAVLSLGVAVYICALLPDSLTRSLVQGLLKFLFAAKVTGLNNFKRAGSKVLIVSNHVSLLDGVILAAFMPERITFAINTGWTQKWFMPIIRLLVDFYPLDTNNPLSVRALIEEVKKGRKVMVFPEGRVTTTGAMMKIYDGAAVIAAKAGAKLLPVRINGAQYSKFSYLKEKFPTKWFPQISLNILEPVRFAKEEGSREQRHQTAHRLYELMTLAMYKTSENKGCLICALQDLLRRFGKKHIVAVEPNGKVLSLGTLVKKSRIYAAALNRLYPQTEKIGLNLPNGTDNLILFFAIAFCGKTAVIGDGVKDDDFPIVKTLGEIKLKKMDKLKALVLSKRKVDDRPLLILQNQNRPQVALSAKALLAENNQLSALLPFNRKDKVLNILPLTSLDAFGFGVLFPLFCGSRIIFFPYPEHTKAIAEISYDNEATIMIADEKVYAACGQVAHQYDFFNLRYAFCRQGVSEEVFEMWVKKFGVRLLAYGYSEAGGALMSINTPMYNRWQTLGNLLPDVVYENGELKSPSFAQKHLEILKFDDEGYLIK